MELVYPPFFPIGNTQDILIIKAVRQITGENVKSAPSFSVDGQKAIKQQEISKATSPEANAGKNKGLQVNHEVTPRVALDLTV